MTLFAFTPYGPEFPPDAIVADIDFKWLRERMRIAQELDGVVHSVTFTVDGGVIYEYKHDGEEDLGNLWVLPYGKRYKRAFSSIEVFPDGDCYFAVLPSDTPRLESCLFSIEDLEITINGRIS